MQPAPRILVATAIFAALMGASLVAAGLAEDGPPAGSPATWGTPESLPGDRGVYKTALVFVSEGKGHYVDMNARFAFERLEDRVMLDANGSARVVQSFVSEWESEPFEFFLPGFLPKVPTAPQAPAAPTCDPEDCTAKWEAWSAEYQSAWEKHGETWEAWGEAFEARFHHARFADWHVTHHAGNESVASTFRPGARLFTDLKAMHTRAPPSVPTDVTITAPVDLSGPCGWSHSLQGARQDMWDPVTVRGACPPDMDFDFGDIESGTDPMQVRVSGRDTVDGQKALVFSEPEDPDRLRLWFTREDPYPVRVLTRIPDAFPPGFHTTFGLDEEPRMYVVHEMVESERGEARAGPDAPALPPRDGARTVTGPALGGFEQAWPLPTAWQEALAHPTACRSLQGFMADNPDATVWTGSFVYEESDDPDHEAPIVDERWSILVSDGQDTHIDVLHRRNQTEIEPSPVPVVGQPQPVRRESLECEGKDGQNSVVPIPGTGPLPDAMPTVGSAVALHAALSPHPTHAYGFTAACPDACSNLITVGLDPRHHAEPDATMDSLTIDEGGGLVNWLQAPSPYPEPRFSDEAWNPARAGPAWAWRPAGAGVWNMPEPVTAGGLAAGAAFAGVMYLLWPALKGALSATPLFTRIRKEDLLEHPVRSQIFELVQSEPGLHFQAIVRRLEKGRGTMEHHIRKLVAGDLLVEKPDRGFTCYFPKGELDRHLMAAAPALKSPGAKQILHAVLEQPGTPAKEIAEKLGMAGSTVNYHIKRLVEAGLVSQSRQGRTMALTSTGLGEQAHGRFGRT